MYKRRDSDCVLQQHVCSVTSEENINAVFKQTSGVRLQTAWSWLLPRLAPHTSWGRGKLQQWWSLDSARLRPSLQRAASSSTAAARRRPWSSRPVGAAAGRAGGSRARSDASECPASEGRGRCGLGYGAGRQRWHLQTGKREKVIKAEVTTALISGYSYSSYKIWAYFARAGSKAFTLGDVTPYACIINRR